MTASETATRRAPVPLYHAGMRCPSCTGKSWIIGRKIAECARCSYPAPLDARDA
jgi:hypothetical protein